MKTITPMNEMHELQAIVLPEDVDERREHDADKPHEEELSGPLKIALRRPFRTSRARRTSPP